LNGASLGVGTYCQNDPSAAKVRVTFLETTTHAAFSADSPCSADDTFALQLAPGTYSVSTTTVYDNASSYPSGTFVVNPSFAVPATGATLFDLRTLAVDGHLTLNGGPLGVGTYCSNNPSATKVRLTFTDATATPTFSLLDMWNALPATSASADVPCGATDSFSVLLPPGTYRVGATGVYDGASSLPSGSFTAVGRIELR
jgi:hypothetical protein